MRPGQPHCAILLPASALGTNAEHTHEERCVLLLCWCILPPLLMHTPLMLGHFFAVVAAPCSRIGPFLHFVAGSMSISTSTCLRISTIGHLSPVRPCFHYHRPCTAIDAECTVFHRVAGVSPGASDCMAFVPLQVAALGENNLYQTD